MIQKECWLLRVAAPSSVRALSCSVTACKQVNTTASALITGLVPTSSTDLPSALCTRVFAVPSAEMVRRSFLHSMVAVGLDITSQLMFTGFPSHE